eukprot:5063791-Heterocapsa_arctica.AAC.1
MRRTARDEGDTEEKGLGSEWPAQPALGPEWPAQPEVKEYEKLGCVSVGSGSCKALATTACLTRDGRRRNQSSRRCVEYGRLLRKK